PHVTATSADAPVPYATPFRSSGLALTGGQASNYTLASTSTTANANITAATVTATVTANNKPYDRAPNATVATCALTGVLSGDAVTCDTTGARANFADPTVATAKTVTISGLELPGRQAGT